jgi:hypothetical protein
VGDAAEPPLAVAAAAPHIENRFDNGETHRVPLRIDAGAVSVAGIGFPGIVIDGDTPDRCFFSGRCFEDQVNDLKIAGERVEADDEIG